MEQVYKNWLYKINTHPIFMLYIYSESISVESITYVWWTVALFLRIWVKNGKIVKIFTWSLRKKKSTAIWFFFFINMDLLPYLSKIKVKKSLMQGPSPICIFNIFMVIKYVYIKNYFFFIIISLFVYHVIQAKQIPMCLYIQGNISSSNCWKRLQYPV